MTRTVEPQDLVDRTVVDTGGKKIGTVGSVYLDDGTHRPEWVTVKTGMFGTKESFVPVRGAEIRSDDLCVGVTKDKVADAPRIDADGHLSQKESAELYRYYGLDSAMDTAGTGNGRTKGRGQQDMVRSEEQLSVGTRPVETGRVRLRKYVVTEQQTVKVPVTREEVRIEREPITGRDGQRPGSIGEEEREVVLHAEEPVVRKDTVPVEKVRLGTEQVAEERTVSGEVRKEKIDLDEGTRRRR